ncbi:MAG: NAD-dependent epimerase/dehydratase family protein [Candidatus Omnitrophota bacterium]
MPGRKIFITGGTGKISRMLLSRLSACGYDMTVLTRKSSLGELPPNVRIARGDILDPQSFSQALSGRDSVLHMAAVTHTNSTERYFNVNSIGTRNMLASAEEQGIKRFIHVSTRAISPDGGGYSRSKIEAERYVIESGLDWVILRPSEVYGTGGNEGIELLLAKFDKMPFVPVIGTGRYSIAPLHISDLLDAIIKVLDMNNLKNKIYTLAGPEDFSYNALVDRIMEIKHVRKFKVTIPAFSVKIISRISSLLFGDRFLASDQVPRLISKKSADISLAEIDLAFKPKSVGEVLESK